jgi:arylsulfatase A-like enzyme
MDNMAPGRLRPDLPTLATHLRAAGYRTAAFYSNPFFAFGLAESFDHHVYLNLPAGEIARHAEQWIRRHADQPFFCFLLLNDPHEPTTPDWSDLQPFLPRLAAQGAGTEAADLRPYARWGASPGVDLTRATHPADAQAQQALQTKLAIYDATIHYVDRVIGTIHDNLAAIGIDKNTLVSVFSDHGEEFLDHADFSHQWNHDPRGIHGIGHGHAHFQEVLQVPWLAWGPGVAAGRRINRPVSLLDLTPTLLDWLGLPPLPGLVQAAAGGGNLGPALVGHSQSAPDNGLPRLILSEAIAYGPDLVALRRDNLKLVAGRDGRVLGLFDLAADPGETRDLAVAQPALVAELLEYLTQWRRSGLGANDQTGGHWSDMDDTVRQRLKDLGYSD